MSYLIHGGDAEGRWVACDGLIDADCGRGDPNDEVDQGIYHHPIGHLFIASAALLEIT